MNNRLFQPPENLPCIQFIWIGPPITVDISSPEMDLDGPIQFDEFFKTNNISNKIIYYCSDDYTEQFKTLLSTHENIEITGLDTYFKNNYEILKKNNLENAVDIFNANKDGDTREKVTSKNIASFMVLYLNGGYYLDTSMFPTSNLTEFKSYDYFQVPLLSEDKFNILSLEEIKNNDKFSTPFKFFYLNLSNAGGYQLINYFEKKCLKMSTGIDEPKPIKITNTMDVDCFIMFSPQYSHQIKQSMVFFIYFYPLLEEEKIKLTNDPNNKKLLEKYHDSSSSLVILSVTNGYYLHKINSRDKWYADLITESHGTCRIIKKLGVKKLFMGSHIEESKYDFDDDDDDNNDENYIVFDKNV